MFRSFLGKGGGKDTGWVDCLGGTRLITGGFRAANFVTSPDRENFASFLISFHGIATKKVGVFGDYFKQKFQNNGGTK